MLKVDLHKSYASRKRVVNIQCQGEIELAKTTALYGKSGIGKSTILRLIAGLESPDSGIISFKDTFWFNSKQKVNLPIATRNIGYVFQDYNLFPNMTVEGNLKYASEGLLTKKTMDLVEIADLTKLMNSFPQDLSGGERQRVAIVRALCQNPELLLLDEPFSALDDDAIGELINAFRRLQSETGITVLMVNHRKDIIFEMADQVLHMIDSANTVHGKPTEVLTKLF